MEHSFITLILTLPVLVLAFGGVLAVLLDVAGYLRAEISRTLFSIVTLIAALCFLQPQMVLHEVLLDRHYISDSFGAVFSSIILLSSIAVVLTNHGTMQLQGVGKVRDISSLLLFSIAGAVGLVSSNNLISLFLCIELLSIPVYIMAGSASVEKASAEGSLKYFILGVVSSAFLLYGMALIYASTGSLDLQVIQRVLGESSFVISPLLLVGGTLLIFGFAFKISLAPFHFWTPDAYQGAPLGINSYMSVVVKVAAFGAMARVFLQGIPALSLDFTPFIILLGSISMLVGNLSAMRQKSIKRLFAYSSIAHAGYAVVCIPLLSVVGQSALIIYLAFYALASLGLYAILVGHLAGTKFQYLGDDLQSLRGMARRDPIAAFLLAVFVLSLTGIPPLAGFFGKFFIILALVKSNFVGLAIFLVMNSAISLFYYLKVIALAYEAGDNPIQPEFQTMSSRTVSTFCGLAILLSIFALDFVSTQSNLAIVSLKTGDKTVYQSE